MVPMEIITKLKIERDVNLTNKQKSNDIAYKVLIVQIYVLAN
jgi:hypothetical protein